MAETDVGPDSGRLRRVLTLYDVTMIVMGSIIGAGVFHAPARIAQGMGSLGGVLAAWAFGGLIAISGALVFAELGGMMPRTGGEYVYIREGAGRFVAFLFGWISLTAIVSSAIAYVAGVFVNHLESVLRSVEPTIEFSSASERGIAVALILSLALLNARGMRLGANVQNVAMLAKIVGISTVIVLGVLVVAGAAQPHVPLAPSSSSAVDWSGVGLEQRGLGAAWDWSSVDWGGVGAALFGIVFTYGGWQNVAAVASEIREPERNLPLGTVIGTACVVALYLGLNGALVAILGVGGVAATETPVATAAGAVVSWGEPLVAVLVMTSTFAITQTLLMLAPRIYLAMGEDGVFFSSVARIHPRWGTPAIAIVLQAALAVAHVFVATQIGDLIEVCSICDWVFFSICGATLFILRARKPDARRPYRAWGYPWMPAIFLLSSAGVLVRMVMSAQTKPALQALALFAVGAVLYFIWRRGARSAAR